MTRPRQTTTGAITAMYSNATEKALLTIVGVMAGLLVFLAALLFIVAFV